MDLLDPFSCQWHHTAFDRLKSHIPFPCRTTHSINIPLKFHCVFFILNFTIANTVISKKSYYRLNIWWDVIYVQREQQGTKYGTLALGDNQQNWSPVRFYSFTTTRCCLKHKHASAEVVWLVELVFYGPSTHFRSFQAQSVNLATLFLGKPPGQFTCNQYLVRILSPVTDNSLSWISGRERMVVENFSWSNLNERMFCWTWGSNPQLSAYEKDTHPIDILRSGDLGAQVYVPFKEQPT